MSDIAKRDTADWLARVVPQLPAETLHQLVLSRGLDACGDIITAATPAQLTSLLDLDLWRGAQPGVDERFDADRFGEWLEVLVDAGDSVAAATVARLDANLVIAGLSRYVRVFDPGIFEPIAQSDDEAPDRSDAMREGGGSSLECEIAGYIIRGRRTNAWDATIALLVALDAEHGDYFHAVMQGCRDLSHSRPEDDGLNDLLQTAEQHFHDIAIEREHRRSRQGYATPAEARAFLEEARRPRRAVSEPGSTAELPLALLETREIEPRAARLSHLRRLMAQVRDQDEALYLTRTRELAMLANTLIAGCSVQSRAFTPQEAADAAAATCNLGLEHVPADFAIDGDLIAAFEAGWSVLHRDVSMFAADQLISMLASLHVVDRDVCGELIALRRNLIRHRDAGAPWRARDATEVLALLDMTAWIGVAGLLDECPVLPAALTAILERGATSVSPTAFEFISTAAQIDEIRRFVQMLPGLLANAVF